MNPTFIERLDPVWDFQLTSALLHFRGTGKDIPDPEIRHWFFKNGYGVQAITAREFLMVGMLLYDVSAGIVKENKFYPFVEHSLHALNLPLEMFSSKECLTIEELESYLISVQNFQNEEAAVKHG